jgi:diacylglycerol kinase family enzyme
MTGSQRIWLVLNEASGSNDRDALAKLELTFREAGLAVERVLVFPDQPLPSGARLDASGIRLVVVFAGDGTVSALISALEGWSGAVLVLPGGTMNLLFHRLHGDRSVADVVRQAAADGARRTRPGVIRCSAGTATADLLAGPGTSWHHVRESMREADLVGVAAGAAQALSATLGAPGVACREPDCAAADEYPMIMLTPVAEGIRVRGFRAETAGEYIEGGLAVLQRRFREGPHDDLGVARRVTLASTTAEPLPLLLDGELAEGAPEEVFRLVPCGVDLLATEPDGR